MKLRCICASYGEWIQWGLIPDAHHRVYFLLKVSFPRHYTEPLGSSATPPALSPPARSIEVRGNICASFRNTDTSTCWAGSELHVLQRGQDEGRACSFPASGGLPLCSWSCLEFMDVGFPVPFFFFLIFCHFVCGRWSDRLAWCWGFSSKHRKRYFYHINLKCTI